MLGGILESLLYGDVSVMLLSVKVTEFHFGERAFLMVNRMFSICNLSISYFGIEGGTVPVSVYCLCFTLDMRRFESSARYLRTDQWFGANNRNII